MTVDMAAIEDNRAQFKDYVRIMRLDHMTKHVFILPGIILALVLDRPASQLVVVSVLVGFVAAVLVASANYVINEWLDREFDRYHPEKSQRAAVQREMSPHIVYSLYGALLVAGLALASLVNQTFFFA
ncbi:MAG: UbiA family prenyltransferase, partial [Pseudomonadota bacterium]